MKHVNRNIRGKSGKIGDSSTAGTGKSGKRSKSKKRPCLSVVVKETATNKAELLPEIPGVEQLDAILPGSKVIRDGFYEDEAALLSRRATTCVIDRRTIFVAPRVGWPKGIYLKPTPQQ